jgi:hypothetical protein
LWGIAQVAVKVADGAVSATDPFVVPDGEGHPVLFDPVGQRGILRHECEGGESRIVEGARDTK